jgi:arsenate reductase
MDKNLSKLTVLAHEGRMSVFRMLVRRYPDAVAAGDIAEALGLKASTLSVYLGALHGEGLIEQHRKGTSRLYRADLTGMNALSDYLFRDCCGGRPEVCAPAGPKDQRPINVLFICTGNSARSIFAEALLRDLGGGRFQAYSAGTTPYSELNPLAIEMLRAKGHEISGLYSKTLSGFQAEDAPTMDFVFTVCDAAANESCPSWEGHPISAHWGLPDPVKATGTQAEKMLAFQQAYGVLKNRISAFAALPVTSLSRNSLQDAVDGIAQTHT